MDKKKDLKEPQYIQRINPQTIRYYKGRIKEIVVGGRKYLEHHFTVDDLCQILHTNRQYVSAALHVGLKTNFATYINRCRIDHAKNILSGAKGKNLTVADIAHLSGFRSRQNFHDTFLRFTGQTPIAFRNSVSAVSEPEFCYGDVRFADLQLLRFRLKAFSELTPRQKAYAYCLSEAALCGRDITTDQAGRYNLKIRKLLEAVYYQLKSRKRNANTEAFHTYLRRVWFSNGIHHHYSSAKLQPGFSQRFLRRAVLQAPAGLLPLTGRQTPQELCDELFPVIFDPAVMPKRVNRKAGDDVIATSACNYYGQVTQAEAEQFYAAMGDEPERPSWGLNSRLVRKEGRLVEEPWTADSLYAPAIRRIIYWLQRAMDYVENPRQKEVLQLLTEYYQTGDLRLFDRFSIAWLQEQQGQVDFINGFIETYGDPLGIKGAWEGIVTYKDLEATRRTQTISSHAQWFEDHSPVDPQFRKPVVKGVTANVVCAAMIGGDNYPASAIGINLPNADWIRARYGSKSVTLCNLTEAYDKAAAGNGFLQEFVIDKATRQLIEQYGNQLDDLHTDLHECLGHGSGQLMPGVSPEALKTYSNTIEEARADLYALYYLADPKLLELGLVPDGQAYRAHYYTYLMNGLLTQLARLEPGEQIEEAHMRNRALIARWTLEHADGAVELVEKQGKTYLKVNDYGRLRTLFALLLAEVQRIKSLGDHEAAGRLVERYAIQVDGVLHAQVRRRYERLHIAPYKGFINPRLTPVFDGDGLIADVHVDYTESYDHQMLRYSRDYGFL